MTIVPAIVALIFGSRSLAAQASQPLAQAPVGPDSNVGGVLVDPKLAAKLKLTPVYEPIRTLTDLPFEQESAFYLDRSAATRFGFASGADTQSHQSLVIIESWSKYRNEPRLVKQGETATIAAVKSNTVMQSVQYGVAIRCVLTVSLDDNENITDQGTRQGIVNGLFDQKSKLSRRVSGRVDVVGISSPEISKGLPGVRELYFKQDVLEYLDAIRKLRELAWQTNPRYLTPQLVSAPQDVFETSERISRVNKKP